MLKKKESPTNFVGIMLTDTQLRELKEYASGAESTVSQTVRRFIREGLERHGVA
jgi:hypothetical protein